MNYQILKEMFDRLLNTNRFWRGVVCCAGIYPDCKAFMDQVKDYFTYTSAKQKAVCVLVGGTDPNVKGMINFTQTTKSARKKLPPELLFELVHCFRDEHGVSNAVFSSSRMLRKFLLPRAVRWQEVRLSKYIGLKTMHERLLSNECWGFVLCAAAFDPDCKAFMERLKDYLEDSSILKQKAVCVLVGDTDPNVKGTVTFIQDSLTTPITIVGQISGLSPGLHGFHVHEFGDLSNGCATAGPHFNPTNKSHGGPRVEFRHVGLLGHVHTGVDGVAKFEFTGSGISLSAPHNIIGRTLVVHKFEDVLGHGLHGEEQENKMITGNAGPRLACGVIMIGMGGP